MLTGEQNGLKETRIKVNDQNDHDQVVLTKNHEVHGLGFHMRGPFNLACVIRPLLEMPDSLHLFKP